MTAITESNRMFAKFIDTVAGAARHVAIQPDEHPKKPDLAAELEQCAAELDEAAKIIEHGYPQVAQVFTLAARRARTKAAIAREIGHA